jgi:CrcB protein
MRRAEEVPGRPARAVAGPARWARGRLPADVLAAVAAGGALGAPARYAVGRLLSTGSFPWATFAVNAVGSFALGFVLVLFLERFPPSRRLRPFVATGVLGAFTTYSTFAVETDLLVRAGRLGLAVAYVVATVAVGLAAVRAGMVVGRVIPAGRRE